MAVAPSARLADDRAHAASTASLLLAWSPARSTQPDLARLESARQALEAAPGSRARQALAAYTALRDRDEKEYVSAVLGVDEYA